MSDISIRRELSETVYIGIHTRGLEGVAALMKTPILTAQVLQEATGEPFRAFMATGAEEVAALEAFMLSRQEVRAEQGQAESVAIAALPGDRGPVGDLQTAREYAAQAGPELLRLAVKYTRPTRDQDSDGDTLMDIWQGWRGSLGIATALNLSDLNATPAEVQS